MKRRTFLRNTAAATGAAPFLLNGIPTLAKSPLKFLSHLPTVQDDNKILIVVQLFGGNDGINTLPPIDDPNYIKLRPNIACVKDNCWTDSTIFNTYFNPGLSGGATSGDKGGLASMMLHGNLAIVRNIGYPYPNLSHFRSTDIWLSGINDSDPSVRLDTGWVGRYLSNKYPDFPASLPTDPLAIQFGGFSLALQAKVGRMGIEVGDPTKQQGVSTALDTLDSASAGTSYESEYKFVADIASRSDKYAQRVKDSYAAGKQLLKSNYATDAFATQMANCAALIAGGLQTKVYVVSLGGFDTHVSQAQQGDGTIGLHTALLTMMSNAIYQFMNDMIRLNLANRIAGVTVSEFGRRPEENGSFGTDHGAASLQFVFGTQVNSGIFGGQFDLSNLDEDQNISFQIDFRRVYLDVLSSWFGLSLTDARAVLKTGLSNEADGEVDMLGPVGLFRNQNSVPIGHTDEMTLEIVSNYPNPFTTSTTIVVNVPTETTITLDISNIVGERVADVSSRTLSAGEHRIPVSIDLPNGFYLVRAQSPIGVSTRMIQCVR